MDKHALLQAIIATLEENVRTLERAAQTAYEAATAEEGQHPKDECPHRHFDSA